MSCPSPAARRGRGAVAGLRRCRHAAGGLGGGGLGIPTVLLFGLPAAKAERGSGAWASDGAVQRATAAIKGRFGDSLLVATDLCLCEYTSHGHCGILAGEKVDNDATLEAYAQVAVSQAEAGSDIVAPSGMMDGPVGVIREALRQTAHSRALS